ncbi:MAG: hypothetical protein TREMPRED_002604 [Tremellales sp. Tagirdzhanova-0007]|nr:MAG: hypothetical protein TREMPRED_002604 [Tremellales sp. Tagirdzhanova-0007]
MRTTLLMASQTPIVATSQQTRFNPTETPDIQLEQVTVTINDRELLSDATLKLNPGVRYALVGRNGSGKSTLLHAIADRLIPGIPSTLRMTLVTQILKENPTTVIQGTSTVLDHVIDGHMELSRAKFEYDRLMQSLSSSSPVESSRIVDAILLDRAKISLEEARKVAARRSGARGKDARAAEIKAEEDVQKAEKRSASGMMDEMWAATANVLLAEIQVVLELLDAANAESSALRILAGLGFTPEMIKSPYAALSGGWRSRAALATGLLVPADLLLLDEPSNFMVAIFKILPIFVLGINSLIDYLQDLQTLLYLERILSNPINPSQTLVLTSHDRTFLDNVVQETILLRHAQLDYGSGSPSQFEVMEAEAKLSKVKENDALDKKREHIEASITKGRRAAQQSGDENRQRMIKSRQRKLDERWGSETSSKGGRFKLNRDLPGFHDSRRLAIDIEEDEKEVRIRIDVPSDLRPNGTLVHLENVGWGYSKDNLIGGVTMGVEQGGRMGLLGANGQGKTTLAKLIVGQVQPRSGNITRHPNMRVGYFTQLAVERLSEGDVSKETPLHHFMEQTVTSNAEARPFLGRWGLGGKMASQTPIGMLSGGQKVRLALAILLYQPPHLLILDEITTHLDAPTIVALVSALRGWNGAVVLITHDRWFHKVLIEGMAIEGDDENEIKETKAAAIIIVLLTSLAGTLFPVITRRTPRLRVLVHPLVFQIAKYFGSGVILSTSIVHLLEPAADDELGPANTISYGGCISDAWTDYPYAFGICLAALFFTFLLELCAFRLGIAYLGQQLGDYSSGPIRPPSRPAELEAGTNANPENDTDVKAINNTGKDESKVAPGEDVDPESGIDIKFKDSDESIPPSAQILGVAILEFGIVFHSVIIGLTIAISRNNQFNTLFIVIIFHQGFEGLGLGTRLSFLQLPHKWHFAPIIGSFLYSFATPLGMVIGLATRTSLSMTSASAAIASGILDSISAGILLYSGTVQLIAQEFILNNYYHTCPWKTVVMALTSFGLGAAIMSLLAKWI